MIFSNFKAFYIPEILTLSAEKGAFQQPHPGCTHQSLLASEENSGGLTTLILMFCPLFARHN